MRTIFRWLFTLLVAGSFALNIFVFVLVASLLAALVFHSGPDAALTERYLSGTRQAADKIVVVHIDGLILEGMTSYARKQIEQAATDNQVKAVVVRINSPGGTITASDELYQHLRDLRDGNASRKTSPKPLVVSMASVAASGGYYVAMPAQQLIAERSTITGSIGVYAAFPNVAELAKTHGVKLEIIKRGDVKASGSMFHDMTAQERQVWQDMVDHAYDQFLAVVREGRGKRLKYPLEAIIPDETKQLPDRGAHGPAKTENGKEVRVEYVRRLADGGIFTADKAQRYGLIDGIGYLEDAVAEARNVAGLGSIYQVVTYDRPRSLLSLVLGVEAPSPPRQNDLMHLAERAAPRLWYLMPQSDLAGLLAASSSEGS
jgi:protease-4